METRDLPIAVFDSGVGGISVLQEMVRLMPEENFYFFGDSIHEKKKKKSVEEVRRLTVNNIAYMAGKGIKAVVIACNTATSAAIRRLRELYTDIPVVGIEPALKPAAMEKRGGRVLVLATPMTVQANKFHDLLVQYEDQATVVPVGCPGLMEFVENGILDGPQLKTYLKNLLEPYLREPVDAVVLGCTHYPFVKETIADVIGPRPHIIDGSEGTARELLRRLTEMKLLTSRKTQGEVLFEESVPEKIELCKHLLGLR